MSIIAHYELPDGTAAECELEAPFFRLAVAWRDTTLAEGATTADLCGPVHLDPLENLRARMAQEARMLGPIVSLNYRRAERISDGVYRYERVTQ